MKGKHAIQMSAALAGKYRFTKPIYGGPVFDFPQYGLTRVNLAELTERQAKRLYDKGWPLIEPIAEYKEEAPAPTRRRAKNDGDTEEGKLEGE